MISNHDSAQLALVECCGNGEWELADMLCEKIIKFIQDGGDIGSQNTPEKALQFYNRIHLNVKEKLKSA